MTTTVGYENVTVSWDNVTEVNLTVDDNVVIPVESREPAESLVSVAESGILSDVLQEIGTLLKQEPLQSVAACASVLCSLIMICCAFRTVIRTCKKICKCCKKNQPSNDIPLVEMARGELNALLESQADSSPSQDNALLQSQMENLPLQEFHVTSTSDFDQSLPAPPSPAYLRSFGTMLPSTFQSEHTPPLTYETSATSTTDCRRKHGEDRQEKKHM